SGDTPWRRSDAMTWFSPPARVSPRTVLPLRSRPSHSKTNSFVAVAVTIFAPLETACVLLCFVGDGQHFLEGSQAQLHLVQARLAQAPHTFPARLLGDLERASVGEDDALHVLADGHHLV